MEKIICNPLNLEYRYQIKKSPMGTGVFREAADPTVVLFKDTYYLFASMSGGFWYSENLYDWKFKATPELPYYDYAPDVREIGGQVVFSASRRRENCTFYRSPDPLNVPFEPVSSPFPFWDPDIFCDDDGRTYFYWGCTNNEPIYGLEVDSKTLLPISERVSLFGENEAEHGWERTGENNKLNKNARGIERMIRLAVGTKPFIEGAYMTKHNGLYYLQYAGPGTQYNVYSDGVYVSEHPLGPYKYQAHNPFSSKPGGFMTGAGHGSTFQDKAGNWWHISTMRISVNENFERRIGLFPCGFDKDGTLYCNQNFADYPFALPNGARTNMDAIAPEWMLLSYGAGMTASSFLEGYEPKRSANEDARSWWAAQSNSEDEWLQMDMGGVKTVRAFQLNFADHKLEMPKLPKEKMHKETIGRRYISVQPQRTCYVLEGSADGENWVVLRNTWDTQNDLPHDFFVLETPQELRYLRLSRIALPFGGVAAVSGMRVFGQGTGRAPAQAQNVKIVRPSALDAALSWDVAEGADGYNVRYGYTPDTLYSSWQVFGTNELEIGMLNKGQEYYFAVDGFNDSGVTSGVPVKG